MSVQPGTRLGPYEVGAQIGVGGMGEVYRATDTNLKRQVAIKVLPAALAGDADRMARFQREAEVLAALNHPHIAQIYGLERSGATTALVMELVEGPTLADRIADVARTLSGSRGEPDKARPTGLPLDEALAIAKQIAEALEAAHAQGIIHRDLKPANIKVREDGTVKVLDFGLAKAMDEVGSRQRAVGSETASQAPTITSPALLTGAGMILGTAAYMSPEQARGKPVDKRADIWAFGCVLFEMLTGQRAFAGDDIADVMVAVLSKEPEWGMLPATAPPLLRRLLRRCLEKSPNRRLHDAADVRLELDDVIAGTAVDELGPRPASPSEGWRGLTLRHALAGVALAVVGAALSLAVAAYLRPATAESGPVRFEIPAGGQPQNMSMSPDGRRIAYSAPVGNSNQTMVFVRAMDALEARSLPGTEGGGLPQWSPDSRNLVFNTSDSRLKRIDVAGGSPQTLTALPAGVFQGVSWGRDGVIVFANQGVLHRVAETGGEVTDLTKLDPSLGETYHFSPWFLPDGRRFLFVGWSADPENRAVYVGSLDSSSRTRLMPAEASVRYAAGHLVFVRERTVMAQPFDIDTLQFTGDPMPIAEQVNVNQAGAGAYNISARGDLIYRVNTDLASATRTLVWLDRNGARSEAVGPPINAPHISLSNDGSRVAMFEGLGAGTADIWVYDTQRNVRTRLTTEPGADLFPVWSPDDTDVVFNGVRANMPTLLRKSSSGASAEQALLVDGEGAQLRARSWSRDGRLILAERNPSAAGLVARRDVVVIDVSGSAKAAPYLATPFDEGQPAFSPDGRFVAYMSNESGLQQVFVRPFPDATAGKWQISSEGGQYPRWRRDGRELYYIDSQGRLVAVEVATQGSLRVGKSTPLFAAPVLNPTSLTGNMPYDVAPDGRFLFTAPLTAADGQATTSAPIIVVLNALAGLSR
ncbi:MAG: protein kinase [Vicinamibacterales bacterium]